jgi:hypothetical protein
MWGRDLQEEMRRNTKLLNLKMEAIQQVVGHVEFDVGGQLANKGALLHRMRGQRRAA